MAEMEADMAAKRNRKKRVQRRTSAEPEKMQVLAGEEETPRTRKQKKTKSSKKDTEDAPIASFSQLETMENSTPRKNTMEISGPTKHTEKHSDTNKPNQRMSKYLHEPAADENEGKKGGKKEKKKGEKESKEEKDNPSENIEDMQYFNEEISGEKKRVTWKGSSELVSMREIEAYDSGSTASHSTHDTQDLGGYCWHGDQHGSNMLVLEDDPTTVRRLPAKQQTDGVCGRYGFSEGRHVIQFDFNDKPWGSHCSIGVCTEEAEMSVPGYGVLFGRDPWSWAWDLPSGRLIHDRQVIAWCPEDPADLPKTIQMCIDFHRDQVTFIVAGEEMPGFTGIGESNAALFPCVSLVYGLSEVKVSLKETSAPVPWSKNEVKEEEEEEEEEVQKEEIVQSLPLDEQRKEERRKEKEEEEVVESLPLGEKKKDEDEDLSSEKEKKKRKHKKKKSKSKKKERKLSSELSQTESEISKALSDKEHERTVVSDNERDNSEAKVQEDKQERVSGASENQDAKHDPILSAIEKERESKNESDFEKDSQTSKEEKEDNVDPKQSETDAEDKINEQKLKSETETETNNKSDTNRHQTENDQDTHNDSNIDLTSNLQENETKAQDSATQEQESETQGQESETKRDESQPNSSETKEAERDETETEQKQEMPAKPETPDPREMEKHQKLEKRLTSQDSYMNVLQQHIGSSESELGVTPPAAAYDPPKRKVKETDLNAIPEATYESPPPSEFSKQETYTTFLEDESEEEEEDEEYLCVEDMEDDEHYLLQTTHGWDAINRGGQLQPYPYVPYICVPMPLFGEKVQMVRSRQGFTRGVHTVCFQEHRFYSPIAKGRKASGNKLLLGVVSESHRTFNYGFGLPSIGPYAWLWDPVTRMIWHDKDKEAYFPDEYDTSKPDDDQPKDLIDMTKGVEMTLNKKGRHVIFTYEGEQVAEIQNVRAKKLFPVVVFNGRGVFPLQISYMEGPKSHITETLKAARTMPHYQREDFHNYRPLTRQLSSKYSMDKLTNPAIDTGYNFGAYSAGIEISGTLTANNVMRQVQAPSNPLAQNLAMADKPLSGQGSRHKIDFISETQDHYIYGLVSRDFDKLALEEGGHKTKKFEEFPLLGSNNQSWCWDPVRQEIRHAGILVGKYPSTHRGFDIRQYTRIRMTVDFSATGYHTCSFEALIDRPGNNPSSSSSGPDLSSRPGLATTVDLGLAFVALPDEVWPVVGVSSRETDRTGAAPMRMVYNSGPERMLTDMRRSAMCSIL